MRTTRFAIVLGLIETSWRGTHGLPEKSLIHGELAADFPHWGRRSSHWQNHYSTSWYIAHVCRGCIRAFQSALRVGAKVLCA